LTLCPPAAVFTDFSLSSSFLFNIACNWHFSGAFQELITKFNIKNRRRPKLIAEAVLQCFHVSKDVQDFIPDSGDASAVGCTDA
jgi:hypothetical protein